MKSRELELVWNLEARGRMDLLNYAMASFGDKKSLVHRRGGQVSLNYTACLNSVIKACSVFFASPKTMRVLL